MKGRQGRFWNEVQALQPKGQGDCGRAGRSALEIMKEYLELLSEDGKHVYEEET